MLVPSTEPKIIASPGITGQTNNPTMATVTDPFPVPGLEGLILKNCRFFSSPDTGLSLIIVKEAAQFRAVVLQTKDNFRGPLLVETGPTIYWALHSLMVQSAESVQNYIQTSGFSIVPSARETKADKETHGFSDSEHGSGDNQGHEADSVTSRSTSCTLPCCTTHKKKKNKGKSVARGDREPRRPKQRGRSLRWRSVSTSREDSYSRSRSRSRGRRRASLSSSGSGSDSRRSRSGSRSSSSSSRRSNARVNSGPTYTRQSVPGPLLPPVKRHNMPHHNRMIGVPGVNPPPLPPPPPGWPLRNMGLNGGIGNGVSHVPPPHPPPPPPPPPPPLPAGFASAGAGKEPCWPLRQFNHFQSQNTSSHGQSMRPMDQYLGPSIRHVQLPSQTLPTTTALQSALPALSAIGDAVPGNTPRLNGHPSKPDQAQHHIPPPPPPPPPPFPQMSRGISHFYGSGPRHVQRSAPYPAAGMIPPPPPPSAFIHIPASFSTSSSSSATITVTPNDSPDLPPVAFPLSHGASSAASSASSGSSASLSPNTKHNSITTPSSSSSPSSSISSKSNKPSSTIPPALITIIFPSHIDPSQLTILLSLPHLTVASVQAVVIEHINKHKSSLRSLATTSSQGKDEREAEVRITAVRAILNGSGSRDGCDGWSGPAVTTRVTGMATGENGWHRRGRKVVDITGFDEDTAVGFLFDQDKMVRFEVEVEVVVERVVSMSSWSVRPPAATSGATGFRPGPGALASIPASIALDPGALPPHPPSPPSMLRVQNGYHLGSTSAPILPPPPPPPPPPPSQPMSPLSMRMQHIPPPPPPPPPPPSGVGLPPQRLDASMLQVSRPQMHHRHNEAKSGGYRKGNRRKVRE